MASSPRFFVSRIFVACTALTLITSPPISAFAAPKGNTKARPAKRPAARKPTTLTLDDHPLIARLTPVESGPGVLICEPVSTGVESAAADFGSGCAKWLHLVVGGQGQLGKTPLWLSVDHARQELARNDLRLSLQEASQLPQSLGVTHAALGEITGDSKSGALKYQLWDLRAKKAVGAPISAAGAEAEIVAALPRLARELSAALGVARPQLPAAVGETPDELRTLGALPWQPGVALPDTQAKELEALASRLWNPRPGEQRPASPVLGAFLNALYSGSRREIAAINSAVPGLTKELPDNALVLAELGRQAYVCAQPLENEPAKQLSALLQRFPHNYLLHSAGVYFHRTARNLEAARKSSELAVRASTRNPDAWLVLGSTISRQANAIRRNRFTDRITPAEQVAVSRFYADQLPVTLKAVLLSPKYAGAWLELSSSAAFLGESELADGAYNKALELAPRDYSVLWWGVQLYQPKWQGDVKKLASIGRMAVEAAGGWSPDQRVDIGKSMQHASLPDLALRVAKTDPERAALKKHAETMKTEQCDE